jgi:hypothetical protein
MVLGDAGVPLPVPAVADALQNTFRHRPEELRMDAAAGDFRGPHDRPLLRERERLPSCRPALVG